MRERGVAPVVATVLLVGVVIALGVVVFFWFKGFTQESVTKFSGENIKLVCGDIHFSATYSGSGGTKEVSIENSGNVPIYSFNVQMNTVGGSYTSQDISSLIGGSQNWPRTGLRQSGTFSHLISLSNNVNSIILIPVLRGTSTNGQEKSYTCESKYGQQLSIT